MTPGALPRAFRCIAFDFDGTLIDSNGVKARAWFRIFPPSAHPHVASVLASNRFGDRFEKVSQILTLIEGEAEAFEVERLAAAYNEICEEEQGTCREQEGATAALAALAKRIPLYVNSATPEEPLVRVVNRRGWAGYFKGVMGRPASKLENLERIAEWELARPQEVLFVGDMSQDREAAEAFGCAFAGVRSAESDLDAGAVGMLTSLSQIEALIEET